MDMLKEAIIAQIVKKWGKSESGCYVNGEWLSPCDIINLIKKI